MVRLRAPPPAQSDIQSARHFYNRIGYPSQYHHGHEVYSKAAKVGIIEEDVVRNRRETSERRWVNVDLRRLSLGHSLDDGKLADASGELPAPFRCERFLENNACYGMLTRLERDGASKDEFARILNNGQRPLALLIKLADYAVTHDGEDKLDGFIKNGRPSLIRQYDSLEEARATMKLDAKTAERLYGPIAELFGYPGLAGDIYLHAFRINHPEIYSHVLATMMDHSMMTRMATTQRLVGEFASVVTQVLRAYGFEADVTLRREKHDGKKMKKMLSCLSDDYASSPSREVLSFEEYVRSTYESFNFERFNDWVAVRVIIRKFRGQDIDELVNNAPEPVERGEGNGRTAGIDISRIGDLLKRIHVGPLALAVKCMADAISSLTPVHRDALGEAETNVIYYEKKNGYRAFHFDTKSGTAGNKVLPFELQLKTAEWHNVAEHGKAAHYYYLGGDNEFVDLIRTAYHDIIHPPEPKSRPFNGAPPSRRSSPSLPLIAESKDSEPTRGK